MNYKLEKLLLFSGKTDKGIFTHVIDTEHAYLTKTAAEYHPIIAEYITGAEKIAGKTQVLLTALGSGEYWGANQNGDYFPENSLSHEGDDYGYQTFVKNAKIYKHHINKDPTAAYGDVKLAVYNPQYKRVELIIIIDNEKAPDIADKIERGDYPDWSMGCRVPYDVCSICGNKAPTRREYCEHLRYNMGGIDSRSGKQVYAINTRPKFFDISQVLIGADKVAKTLRKVASVNNMPVISSAYIAEKMAEGSKYSAIDKEVPLAEVEPPIDIDKAKELAESIIEVKAKEPNLPKDLLDKLGTLPLQEVMTTLSSLGILPKPQEFQRILLISIGKGDVADKLDSHGMCFDPESGVEDSEYSKILGLAEKNFNPDIMRLMEPHMASRSYSAPHLSKRITILVKQGAEDQRLPTFIRPKNDDRKPLGIMPLMITAAGLYATLASKAPAHAMSKIDRLITSQPGLAAALGIGLMTTFGTMFGPKLKGNYTEGLQEPDVTDIFKKIEEQKAKPFLKIGGLGAAAKRLFLGIPAVYMASGVLQKTREARPYEQEGNIRKFIRKYPDLIGAGLMADAMLATRGKGSTRILGGLSKMFKGAMDDTMKLASVDDLVSHGLIWPLAFRMGPPGVVGGLVDASIFRMGKKLLSNNRKQPKIGVKSL